MPKKKCPLFLSSESFEEGKGYQAKQPDFGGEFFGSSDHVAINM